MLKKEKFVYIFKYVEMNISHHVSVAIFLRVGLLLYGIYHDRHHVLKYTDIDYYVFSDAARLLFNGKSPFERDTYRYSPLLAFILTPNTFLHEAFGKFLFLCTDVLTGILIYIILKERGHGTKTCLMCSSIWLYNPVSAVISTRGSCDSILTALMLACIYLFQRKQIILFGLIYGLTVHFRLYPCIHALTFYVTLSDLQCSNTHFFKKLHAILRPTHEKCTYIICTLIGFSIPTIVSYYFYGMLFVKEAFLYHIHRKDIKHNFSPYFYFTYLSESADEAVNVISILPFIFQMALLLLTSCIFSSKHNLPNCLFIQTFIFVTFNKVCTSQYFLWYLCLLPLNISHLKMYGSLIPISVLWLCGQGFWLIPAYYLEFEGMNMFLIIWCASLVMFLVYIYLLYLFIKTCPVLLQKRIDKVHVN